MTIPPELTPENTPYWTGGAEGHLMIGHCDTCGRSIHPPQPCCPACHSDRVRLRPALGTGTVIARTVNRQAWSADMPVPFALAVVELDGETGVRITARVDCENPATVAIGDRVTAAFEQDGEIWRPYFRLTRPIA